MQRDKEFVAMKMGISTAEFDKILERPQRSYKDYPSNAWLFELKAKLRGRRPPA